MITERTLKKWRKEALVIEEMILSRNNLDSSGKIMLEDQRRILRMTQEMLDMHLLRKS